MFLMRRFLLFAVVSVLFSASGSAADEILVYSGGTVEAVVPIAAQSKSSEKPILIAGGVVDPWRPRQFMGAGGSSGRGVRGRRHGPYDKGVGREFRSRLEREKAAEKIREEVGKLLIEGYGSDTPNVIGVSPREDADIDRLLDEIIRDVFDRDQGDRAEADGKDTVLSSSPADRDGKDTVLRSVESSADNQGPSVDNGSGAEDNVDVPDVADKDVGKDTVLRSPEPDVEPDVDGKDTVLRGD